MGHRYDYPAVAGGAPAFPEGLAFARPFTPPLDKVVARFTPSYERGVLTNGPVGREFEEASAERLGVSHAIGVSSCTSGMMLALKALGVEGPVVLPSFTFSATAHAVAWNDLQPVFAECDAATFQLDIADAARRIEPGGAIIGTHVFGSPCRPRELEKLAHSSGAALLFDAAHAFGAMSGKKAVGGFGDVEVFSLSPTKLVVGGEGGLVTTNRSDVAAAVRLGRDYGNPPDYDCRFAGLSARMSELHASVAIESLAVLDEHLDRRTFLARAYQTGLGTVPGIEAQAIAPGDVTTWKDFAVTVDEDAYGLPRNAVVKALRAEGIDVRVYFSPPVHTHQCYVTPGAQGLPVTDRVAARVLCLPMHTDMSWRDVERVVQVLATLHTHAAAVLQALDASG